MPRFVNPDNSAFQVSLNSEIYVDKTELIGYTNSVLESTDAFICNSRPRRFGKSFTVNMLSAYYSKGADSLQMFSDLLIGKDATFRKYLNKYDVIQIDIQWFISVCKDRSELVSYISRKVIEELRNVYPHVISDNISSIRDALSQIYEKTGNRFIIIIDEWDSVIRDPAFTGSGRSEYIHFIQNLFEGSESEKYIALAWLTGILPIRKEKINFLSNFHQLTILNSDTTAKFMGFTENEVRKLCSKYHQDYNELKKWYGGYLLNGYELFNPMAVCRHMRVRKYNDYWSATSSYEVISELLSMNITGVETMTKGLLSGSHFETDVHMFQNDLHKIKTCDGFLTYLIHLGYLGFDEKRCTVFIPNEDVRKSWEAAVQ